MITLLGVLLFIGCAGWLLYTVTGYFWEESLP